MSDNSQKKFVYEKITNGIQTDTWYSLVINPDNKNMAPVGYKDSSFLLICKKDEFDDPYFNESMEERQYWHSQNFYRFKIFVENVPHYWECPEDKFEKYFIKDDKGQISIKNKDGLMEEEGALYRNLTGDYCIEVDKELNNKVHYNSSTPILIPEFSGLNFVKI